MVQDQLVDVRRVFPLARQLLPKLVCIVARTLCDQIIEAGIERALREPARPFEPVHVYPGPARPELVDALRLKDGRLPFGAGHNMIVVVAKDVAIDARRIQYRCIQIGVVRDIPDMKNARSTAVSFAKPFDPGVWERGLTDHRGDAYPIRPDSLSLGRQHPKPTMHW
jgi:hypothetical protein